jgi:uncharacterized repeat protein (TIGR02059 family)
MRRKISGVLALLLATNLFSGSLAGVAMPNIKLSALSKTAIAAALPDQAGITEISPMDGEKGVPLNAKLKIKFAKKIRFVEADITVTGSEGSSDTISLKPAEGVVQEFEEITLTPPSLSNGVEYTVTIPEKTFLEVDTNNPLPEIQWSFTTVSLGNTAPVLNSVSPTGQPVPLISGNLVLSMTFSEAVEAGTGSIKINRVSDNQTVETIPAVASVITPQTDGKSLVEFTAKKLSAGERYYVLVDKQAFKDTDWTPYQGISDANQWTFTVKGSPVRVTQYAPTTTGVSPLTTLTINFSRNVYPVNGNILIKKGSQTEQTISVTSPEVTGGDSKMITITPKKALTPNTVYTIEVPAGAFEDSDGNRLLNSAGNNFPGNVLTWTFTTGTTASTTLSIVSVSPRDQSVNNAVTSTLKATFNKEIDYLSNSDGVRLYKQGVNTPVTTTVNVNPSNKKELIITPSNLDAGATYLDAGATYYVDIDPGVITDLSSPGSVFAGLKGTISWTFQTVAADKTAPVLQNATMYSNSTIRLQYNETLDSSVSLLTSSFTVTVNGETRKLSSASVSGDSVYVTLETGVAVGQKVTISYVGNSVRPIRDVAGNNAATFSKEVTNSIDSVLPKPTDGYVSGSTLTLYFSDSLKSVSSYAYQQFSVTADGYSKGINGISQSGRIVTLYLSSSVSNGEVVKVSYSPGSYPLQDSRGQNIAAFSDYYVRNSYDTKPPEVTNIEGSGNKIVLTYNEALRTTSIPMKSQFSVLVNNSPIYVTNVEIKEDQVILTLASSFTQTQNVTLSYVSGVGGIADLNGNLAGYIDLRPVSYGLVMEGIRSAIVRGDTITVTFNGGLMPISNLSISQFYVAVDLNNRTIQSASISGDTLTIKLSSPVTKSQTVKLSYMEGATPLYQSTGTKVKGFSDLTLQNLTDTETSTGTTNGVPSYLTALSTSDFGKSGYVLGTNSATTSSSRLTNGTIVNKYTLDSAKVAETLKYFSNSNVSNRMLVFEVPSTEKAAQVVIPMSGFMEYYNSGKTGSLAVRYGSTLFELPIEKIPFSELYQSLMVSSINSANLFIQLEPVSKNQLPRPTTAAGINISSIADPIQISVSATNASGAQSSGSLDFTGQLHYRAAGQASAAAQASLVQYDTTSGALSHVPSKVTSSGANLLFDGTITGNTTIGPALGYSYFSDTTTHWAKNDILELANKLIVEPRSNSGTNFEPNKNITRAEFAVFIAKGLGLAGDEASARRFPDVSSGTTAAYIGAAAKAGIINGNADGTFKPNSNITREQMALMMVRAMEYAGYNTSMNGASTATLTKFKDAAKIQSKETVAKAVKEGIIQGVTTNTFQPQGNATRAQAAVMLKRVLDKLNYI